MIIGGLQKLTLLDYPGKVACTVFTAGCDFRCPFCHNAALVLPGRFGAAIPEREVLDFLAARVGKLDGVCITGGEPLLQPGLEAFMAEVHALGLLVKLDTNGNRPDRLEAVLKAGLADYVAMDLKNEPARYAETAGVGDVDPQNVLRSMRILRDSGVEYEFRTTVVRELHSEENISAMAELVADSPWFLQTFVDNGNTLKPGLSAYSAEEMAWLRDLARQKAPNCEVRGL